MGGSHSSTKSDIFLSTVNDAFVKNVNRCTSSTTVSQQLKIDGDGNIVDGGSMVSVQKLTLSCDQNSQALVDMQNQVAQAIKQAATAQNEALLGALQSSNSDVDSTIRNDVQNHLNLKNINELITNTNAAQGIDIRGNNNIVRNFTQSDVQDILSSNSQKILQQMKTVNAITQQLDQKSDSTVTNPISEIIASIGQAIADVWNAMTGPLKWILIVIAVVLVAYLFSGYGSGAEERPRMRLPMQNMPNMQMPYYMPQQMRGQMQPQMQQQQMFQQPQMMPQQQMFQPQMMPQFQQDQSQ